MFVCALGIKWLAAKNEYWSSFCANIQYMLNNFHAKRQN